MAQNKYLLFGLESDSKLRASNTWSVNVLKLNTLQKKEVQTCYEYVIPLAVRVPLEATRVNNNVNVTYVCKILGAIADLKTRVTRIVTTNLKVNVIAMGLTETLSNDLGCSANNEIKQMASIVLVYCRNYSSMRSVYNQLKSIRVSFLHILPIDDDIFFGMDVFIKTFGKRGETSQQDSSLTLVSSLVFQEENLNIKRVYTPYGVYILKTPTDSDLTPYGGIEIKLLNVPPPTLDQVMPVVSMDIETIAPTCNIIPKGTSLDERLSSLVLYCRYGSSHYTLVLFLAPAKVDTAIVAEFCRVMSKKYSDHSQSRMCDFKAFSSEKKMLYVFYTMYIKGGLWSMFSLPPDHPHVFVGHNIIQYDIPFLLERFKIYNIQSLLLDTGSIVMPYSEQICFNFCTNGLLFDSMFLAKANCLSGTFSLSALAAARLDGDKIGKMELNSVSIRNLYNLAQERCLSTEEVADVFAVDEKCSMADFECRASGSLNLAKFPISYAKMENYTLAVPRMETILAYNIQDTITVMDIMIDSHVFTIINQLTRLFGVSLDAASMRGNSCRIGACLTLESLADGQFLYSLIDKTQPKKCVLTPIATSTLSVGSFSLRKFDALTNGVVISADLTKAGFRGALNYAHQGVFKNVRSIDFKSYYPNLMRFLNCDYGSVDIVNRGDLIILNREGSLEKLITLGHLDLYRMDDPTDVETADLLDVRYRGREIGHCMCWEDVMCESEGPDTPILCILRDRAHTTKDSFLTKLITKRLNRRDAIKRVLKGESDPTIRSRLDSEQLSEKILLNSKYGLKGNPTFHNKHLPLSAAVTMFGRKLLTVCARLIVCYQILARREAYSDEVISEIETHLVYLKRNSLNCASNKAMGLGVCRDTFTCETERFVCYVDTDGIKYYDPYGLNGNKICQQINDTLEECLGQNYLALSVEPEVDRLLVLTCKSYATFTFPDKVTHTGYEKNVNPTIKYILNSIVRVNQLDRQTETPPMYILYDVFRYLSMMNQAVMFGRVKLNKHKNESSLKRYICSLTNDFRGDVPTVMLRNDEDVEQDWYMSHAEWLNSAQAHPINTFKFIRKNFLIMLRLIFINVDEMRESLEQNAPVAKILIKESIDSYGGRTYTMNWEQAKVMGKITFIICTGAALVGENLKFINRHRVLYDYCHQVYSEYTRVISYTLEKCPDVTTDGMRPKTKNTVNCVKVFFKRFSVFE